MFGGRCLDDPAHRHSNTVFEVKKGNPGKCGCGSLLAGEGGLGEYHMFSVFLSACLCRISQYSRMLRASLCCCDAWRDHAQHQRACGSSGGRYFALSGGWSCSILPKFRFGPCSIFGADVYATPKRRSTFLRLLTRPWVTAMCCWQSRGDCSGQSKA
jgi:hypothetical protein